MNIGLSLHNFRTIIFIDHVDCGAFKSFYPEMKPENEIDYHKQHLQKAYDELVLKFPNFDFRSFIMDLNGDMNEFDVSQTEKLK